MDARPRGHGIRVGSTPIAVVDLGKMAPGICTATHMVRNLLHFNQNRPVRSIGERACYDERG
jgi:hypothetical protein